MNEFMSQDWVKEDLGVPLDHRFIAWNSIMWQAFHDSGSWHVPTTRELIDVLDAYRDEGGVGDIKVLIFNGNWDVILNTPGIIWLANRLKWSGQSDFRMKQFQPLPEGMGVTGEWKATMDGRLALLTVDGVGHYPTSAQSEGFYRIYQRWLCEGWQM